MLVYKVLTAEQAAAFTADGQTEGAPVDLADGYIHLSTAGQLAGTLATHFAGQGGLVLLALEPEALGSALRWEPSRGGALFPHLYRVLTAEDVSWRAPLPLGADGVHVLPEGLA